MLRGCVCGVGGCVVCSARTFSRLVLLSTASVPLGAQKLPASLEPTSAHLHNPAHRDAFRGGGKCRARQQEDGKWNLNGLRSQAFEIINTFTEPAVRF